MKRVIGFRAGHLSLGETVFMSWNPNRTVCALLKCPPPDAIVVGVVDEENGLYVAQPFRSADFAFEVELARLEAVEYEMHRQEQGAIMKVRASSVTGNFEPCIGERVRCWCGGTKRWVIADRNTDSEAFDRTGIVLARDGFCDCSDNCEAPAYTILVEPLDLDEFFEMEVRRLELEGSA